MKTLFNRSIIAALSCLFVMAINPANATENPFGMSKITPDMSLASNHDDKCGSGKKEDKKEGKCGEGKCGAERAKAQGKCGDSMKMKDGKCGNGKAMEDDDDDKNKMKSKCGGE